MNLNIASLKAYAASRLEDSRDALRKQVLIYVLVWLGAQLLSLLGGQLLITQADKMTGLSAAGVRSILMSAQQVLNILVSVLTPLWTAGYWLSCLDAARGKSPEPKRLTYGLSHAGKYIFSALLVALRILLFSYLAAIIMSLFMSFLVPASLMGADPNAILSGDGAALDAAVQGLMPLVYAMLAVVLVIAAVMLFRYRLLYFVAADYTSMPSGHILRVSSELMRGLWGQFIKLDLSFWWYWLLYGLVQCLSSAGLVMLLLDIPFPIREDLFLLLLDGAYLLAFALFHLLFANRVRVTYAAAYDQLLQMRLQSQPQA